MTRKPQSVLYNLHDIGKPVRAGMKDLVDWLPLATQTAESGCEDWQERGIGGGVPEKQ